MTIQYSHTRTRCNAEIDRQSALFQLLPAFVLSLSSVLQNTNAQKLFANFITDFHVYLVENNWKSNLNVS